MHQKVYQGVGNKSCGKGFWWVKMGKLKQLEERLKHKKIIKEALMTSVICGVAGAGLMAYTVFSDGAIYNDQALSLIDKLGYCFGGYLTGATVGGLMAYIGITAGGSS